MEMKTDKCELFHKSNLLLMKKIFSTRGALWGLASFLLGGMATHAQQDPVGESAQDQQSNIVPTESIDSMEGLLLTSKAFRAAAEKIRPCLVTIESFGGVGTVQGRIGGIRQQGEGATTGVMISPDGFMLTSSFNFIQRQPVISVVTSDGVRRLAQIVGQDDTRKICLLKIDGVADMPVPEIARLDEMRVGQWTVSVGVGYGDTTPAISKGILSAKNRIGGRAIQTDARISPANYGGPLIDLQGRLMGICVPLDPQSAAIGAGVAWYDSGIGFAIPLDGNDDLIERMKRGETIAPPWLGISPSKNPAGKGILIQRVVDRSPADQAGLVAGNVVVSMDGNEVNDLMQLKQILNRLEAGQTVTLMVAQPEGNTPKEIEVTLAVPPKPSEAIDPLKPPEIR